MKKLMDRIEKYGFTCEAGPLENCVEWVELKNLINAMHSDGQSDVAEEIWTNEDESAEIERQIVENTRR